MPPASYRFTMARPVARVSTMDRRQCMERSYRRKLDDPYSLSGSRPSPGDSAHSQPIEASTSHSNPNYDRISFIASQTPEAKTALKRLTKRYGNVALEQADIVVALGGDGLMLQTLHRLMNSGKPIYGMHRGTIGFLMNDFRERNLKQRLAAAES